MNESVGKEKTAEEAWDEVLSSEESKKAHEEMFKGFEQKLQSGDFEVEEENLFLPKSIKKNK